MNVNQPDLFDENPVSGGFIPDSLNEEAKKFVENELFELSVQAYTTIMNAGMNDFFSKNEINYYILKIFDSVCDAERRMEAYGGNCARGADRQLALRTAAETAAFDRSDSLVRAVLDAAYQSGHEIHRLVGLLRFSPEIDGMWVARCAPDHSVLYVLADHFYMRFGEASWAIIDEKRGAALVRQIDMEPVFGPVSDFPFLCADKKPADNWEDLWRSYHRLINIENRKNLNLQRQLMPSRYWKYLPEVNSPPGRYL